MSHSEAKRGALTSNFRLHEIINEPIYTLAKFSSCINLIFTHHPDLVMESQVHPSLHLNFQYMAYVKFNFKICYPPTY